MRSGTNCTINSGQVHSWSLGWSLGWYANMKELRANTADKVLRIALAFDPDRSGILLIGGDKSGVSKKRFYKQLIEKADQLYAAHLAALKAKKKGKK